MREGTADAMLGEFAMAKQAKLIEEGLKRISTRGAVAYGRTELESAVEQGSIENPDYRSRSIAQRIILVRNGCKYTCKWWPSRTSSANHDAGEELMGLGGAIGLLRWNLE